MQQTDPKDYYFLAYFLLIANHDDLHVLQGRSTMNTANRIQFIAKAVIATAFVIGLPSTVLATTTWSVSQFQDTATTGDSAVAESISAFSTGGTSTVSNPAPSLIDTTQSFKNACIHRYGSAGSYAWGVVNIAENSPCEAGTTSPQHAADNRNGTDLFMLKFKDSVDLETVKIGWNGTDNPQSGGSGSDMSILAYTGSEKTAPAIANKTFSSLLSSGWTLVGHYGNVGSPSNNTLTINSNISSSWWLVSAYNANYGSSGVSSSGQPITSSVDYFKLMNVAGTVTPPSNQVPEPSSLALAAAGLIGMLGFSRRRQARR